MNRDQPLLHGQNDTKSDDELETSQLAVGGVSSDRPEESTTHGEGMGGKTMSGLAG
jgi:hypothetical protein